MKKSYKLLAVLVAVVLVVCCCCIPASAATIKGSASKDVFDYYPSVRAEEWNVSGDGLVDYGDRILAYSYEGSEGYHWTKLPYWWNDYSVDRIRRYDIDYMFKTPFELDTAEIIKLAATLRVSPCSDPMNSTVYMFRIGYLWNYADTPFQEAQFRSMVQYDKVNYGIRFPFDVTSEITTDRVILGVRIQFFTILDAGESCHSYQVTWDPNEFSCRYGDRDSVAIEIQNDKTNETLENLTTEQEKTNEYLGAITADKYSPPSGQDQMGELAEKEEAVNQSAQEGMDEAGNMFKAFSLDFFTDGLGAVVQIYNRIIPKIPWLNQLITISLALGLFSFLVGAAQAYIGRLNANDRKAQREQARRRK